MARSFISKKIKTGIIAILDVLWWSGTKPQYCQGRVQLYTSTKAAAHHHPRPLNATAPQTAQ